MRCQACKQEISDKPNVEVGCGNGLFYHCHEHMADCRDAMQEELGRLRDILYDTEAIPGKCVFCCHAFNEQDFCDVWKQVVPDDGFCWHYGDVGIEFPEVKS